MNGWGTLALSVAVLAYPLRDVITTYINARYGQKRATDGKFTR